MSAVGAMAVMGVHATGMGLTAHDGSQMLATAGVAPERKVLDLGARMRCRECGCYPRRMYITAHAPERSTRRRHSEIELGPVMDASLLWGLISAHAPQPSIAAISQLAQLMD
jgi:hypothetical protein